MRYSGLLNKTKFQVLVILVLFIQLLGNQQIFFITNVKGAATDPKLTIDTPITGDFSKVTNVTISGTVENMPPETPITLYDGTEEKGTTNDVIDNIWTISIPLAEGIHTITAGFDVDGVQIISNPIELTIDSTLPNITFINPSNGDYLNSRSIEGTTEPSAAVKICMDCTEDSEGKVIGTWVSVNADSMGKWVYQDSKLTEGSHTVYANATDLAGNNGNINKATFILDTLRPQVLPDIFPKQDMTQVSLNPTIRVKISDATALNDNQDVISKSINLSHDGINVDGTINYNNLTNEITFTPLNPLSPSTKYNVLISPLGIIDSAENSAFPRFWSFTTVGTAPGEHQNPHGSYTNNVNTCGNCHNTHASKDPELISPKMETAPEQIVQKENLASDNYCMACHDGTVAPLPENRLTAHTHNAAVKIDGKPSGSSCASCHNPHLDWSEKNPNMAQDHITYKHLPSDPVDPNKPTEEISSKEQLCESCHENDSAERIANPAVEYRVFKYSKSSTAIGIYEDYELCLRCHNGDFKQKYEKIADIASHYNNLTEEIKKQYEDINGQSSFSNREITVEEKDFSGHIIKAQDGSPLVGYLPCAECHDTHGSNNIKQLKESLGHESVQSFNAVDTDSKIIKVLIGSTEREFKILTDSKGREFCMACHNGTTAIYGVTGQKYDSTRIQHSDNPDKACSYCHGRGETEVERAFSAAHAPKQGIVPEP
ncbi:cytochrome c3 family protein [Neobacillus sp. YX16]|uniref:multiheme c-type cytochrome n=1 Tax=Neobacillus sp. YX16 TaxID=3047874 RepID=UPI0024C2715B|nr:Ig-like domain-containing protein [Neobacillus sp. YX16]WHZ02352.1 cytochrome c3 family protein [Neobacillus sp. YX16]